MAVVVKTLHG